MIKNKRGYTLLELILACAMATLVLYGLYTTFTSMVNFQEEAVRKGSVNAWTVASLGTMTKEIEDADILYYPNSATTTSTTILGCTNWSSKAGGAGVGGPLNAAVNVTKFMYCLDTTTGPTSPAGGTVNVLRRVAISGSAALASCPAVGAAVGALGCTNATTFGAGTINEVIATEINFAPGLGYMFSYNNSATANGVSLNFVIGNPNPSVSGTPTPGTPSNARIINPQTTTVNTTIALERPYMDSND